MEIVELSGSPISDLGRYLRSRVQLRIYLPLALFLTVAAQVGGRPPSHMGLAFLVVLAYLWVLHFRLWDDLSDRECDRLRHPNRVLSQAGTVWIFHGLRMFTFALATAMVASRDGAVSRLTAVAILCGVLFIWYRVRRRIRTMEIANYHLVLMKYPVIIYLLGSPSREGGLSHLFMAMVMVYLCFCIYEVLHDNDLSAAQGARAALALEMWALGATSVLMAATLFGLWRFAGLLQGTLALVSVLFLARLFHLYRTRAVSSQWSYAVFVISFLQVLTFGISGSL